MKRSTMQFGVIKEEQFVTEDGKTFDSFDEASEHQQDVFKKGVKLNLETEDSSFGEMLVMPEEFDTIIVFTSKRPVHYLRHQLYMDMIFNTLKDVEEVKVLGLDKNKQPLELITVATREVQS